MAGAVYDGETGLEELGSQVGDVLLVFAAEFSPLLTAQDADGGQGARENRGRQRRREDKTRRVASQHVNQVS